MGPTDRIRRHHFAGMPLAKHRNAYPSDNTGYDCGQFATGSGSGGECASGAASTAFETVGAAALTRAGDEILEGPFALRFVARKEHLSKPGTLPIATATPIKSSKRRAGRLALVLRLSILGTAHGSSKGSTISCCFRHRLSICRDGIMQNGVLRAGQIVLAACVHR